MSTDHLSERDPVHIAKVLPFLKLAMKGYFRSEVRDVDPGDRRRDLSTDLEAG